MDLVCCFSRPVVKSNLEPYDLQPMRERDFTMDFTSDSETESNFSFSSNISLSSSIESDAAGMQAVKATSARYAGGNSKHSPPKHAGRKGGNRSKPMCSSASSAMNEVMANEMEEYAKRLEKTICKFPTTGRRLFNASRERYFAVVGTRTTQFKGNTRHGDEWKGGKKCQVDLQEPTLCYWRDYHASKTEEPLGSLHIASIEEVQHNLEEDYGLIVTLTRSAPMESVPHVGERTSLTLKFATSAEAASWASDLQDLIRWAMASMKQQ